MGKRTRGGTAGTPGPAALSSSYAYNVRGWLTGIGGSLFSETLAYETPRPGSLDGEWGGNISSATWKTAAAPSDSTWYDYGYDRLGRLVDADYGSSASSAGNHGHSYWYDLNGNMTGRESPGQHTEFAAGDRQALLSWTFSEGNAPVRQLREYYKATTVWGQPHPWQPPRPVIVMEPETLGRVEEYFTYDAAGIRTATRNAQGDTLALMRYNLLNLPQEYVTAAGDTVWYVYSADGEKLFVKKNLLSGSVTGTEYAANYRIDNGTLAMIHTDAGYYTPVTSPGGAGVPSYMHVWYLKDHLGNNRVLAEGGGNALAVHDYAPYGDGMSAVTTVSLSPFPSGASGSPYRYGGKEWGVPTSTYDFEARQFSPSFHRFTSMDPLAEKYYSISPYAYCADDPVNVVDPEGKSIRIRRNKTRAIKDLAKIAATSRGQDYLRTLIGGNKIGMAFETEYRLDPVSIRYRAGFDGQYINYLDRPWFPVGGGSKDEFALMGHEIRHAFDHSNHDLIMKKNGKARVGRIPSEENAVTFENYLRSVFGIEQLRTRYTGLTGRSDFNPTITPYLFEQVTDFSQINEDKENSRYGYSYISTINGESSLYYLVVGIDSNDHFYFNVFDNEEEYKMATGW